MKLKKILLVVLTTFSFVFASFSLGFVKPTFAAVSATVNVIYPWESFSQLVHDSVICVSFDDYVTGSFSIKLSNCSNYDYICIDGRITNYNTNTGLMNITVDDTRQVLVVMTPQQDSLVTDYPTAILYTNSTSSVTHVNQSWLESKFATTNGYLDDIESASSSILSTVNSMYTLLGTLENEVDGVESLLSDMEYSLSSILTAINSLNDNNYNIPLDSLMAYAFFREMSSNGISTLSGYYAPYYAINSLTKTNVLLRTGYTYYLSYMVNRTNSGFISTIKNEDNTSANFSVVGGLPLVNGVRVITYAITVNTQGYYTFTWNNDFSGIYVIPLYYGNGLNLSDEMKSITGIDVQSTESQTLEAISDWLNDFDLPNYSLQLDAIVGLLTAMLVGNDEESGLSLYDIIQLVLQALQGIESFNVDDYLPLMESIYNKLTAFTDYVIPLESYTAYSLFRNMGSYTIRTLNGFTAPYIAIDSLSVSNVLLRTGYTYYLSYLVNRTNSGFISSIDNRVTYNTISGLIAVNNSRVITYEITVSETDWYTITWYEDFLNCFVVPLYFGNGLNISDEMKSITAINIPNEDSVLDLDPNNISYTGLNYGTHTIFTALSGYEDSFGSSFNSIDNTGIFTKLDNMSNAFNFVKVNLETIYSNLGDLQILIYVPLLLGLVTLILGFRRR